MGKAMKSMKKTPLKKGNGKACKKPPSKAVKKNPCKKGTAKKNPPKLKLSAANLRKLGEMSWQDKLKKAGEEETVEGAKVLLQKIMSRDEKARLWSKHNTYLKTHEEERKEYEAGSKKEKGDKTTLWLLKKEHPKFLHVSKEVSGESAALRKEKWVSETVILTKWTWEELQAHLSSGRIVARECPSTWGVWEYCDMQDWQHTQKAKTKRKASLGQEGQPNSEDEGYFQDWASGNLQNNAGFLCSGDKGLAKSSGKGQTKGGKGKGFGKNPKGKGKGQELPALTNGEEETEQKEESEEEQFKFAMKKAKKARDITTALCADLEDCLGKANPYLSKQAKQNGLKDQQMLVAMGNKLKDIVAKQNVSLKKLKSLLQENATKVKDVKDTMKEMKQLANKANSIASKAETKNSSKKK
eukprot:Skav214341  [mRNA]  locus=scaffold86:385449:386684:- [translate_table: standard]